MDLTKISSIGADGFPHKVKKIFAKKCDVFIAKGRFSAGDIPSNIAALEALTSPTGKFLPFGEMDGSGNNITWTAKTYEIDHGPVTLHYEVTATMVSVTVKPDMLHFVPELDSGEYSFLYKPDGFDDIFYALSGVSVSSDGSLVITDGDNPSKITFKASRKCSKITDVILFEELDS